MSKFMMFAFSVGLTIGSIAFACLLKWYERSGWGWFLLMGFFFWSSALNVYEKRELVPTYAPQFDLSLKTSLASARSKAWHQEHEEALKYSSLEGWSQESN